MGQACSSPTEKTETQESVATGSNPAEVAAPAAAPVEEAQPAKLNILILAANGVRNADWVPGTGVSDCYCVVKSGTKELCRTKTIPDSLMPNWNEEFEVDCEDDMPLKFVVMDDDLVAGNLLGEVELTGNDYKNGGVNKAFKLEKAGGDREAFIKLKIKFTNQEEYPTGEPSTFKIEMVKKGETSYGLDLDTTDSKYLLVTNVKEGAFQKYNNDLDAESKQKELRRFDFIHEANGESNGAQTMLEKFKKDPEMEVKVYRPVFVSAILTRDAKGLAHTGLTFPDKLDPNSRLLLIKGIGAGPVQAFNESCQKEDDKLKVGDRIIQVNGVQGKAKELKTALEKKGSPPPAEKKGAPPAEKKENSKIYVSVLVVRAAVSTEAGGGWWS